MSIAAKWQNALGIAPSDTQGLPRPSQALCIAVGGTVTVDMAGGQTSVLLTLPAGVIEIGITKLYATGTTATGFAILWS